MRSLQRLAVRDAFHPEDRDLILVKTSESYSSVIERFARQAELRGIFVVDEENRYVGVITRTDLLDWARVKLGAAFLQPLTDTSKTIRLASLINALTVEEVLRPETRPSAVHPHESLAQALKMMIESDLIILPVIDDNRRIIGSLTLSELLTRVLSETEKPS